MPQRRQILEFLHRWKPKSINWNNSIWKHEILQTRLVPNVVIGKSQTQKSKVHDLKSESSPWPANSRHHQNTVQGLHNSICSSTNWKSSWSWSSFITGFGGVASAVRLAIQITCKSDYGQQNQRYIWCQKRQISIFCKIYWIKRKLQRIVHFGKEGLLELEIRPK